MKKPQNVKKLLENLKIQPNMKILDYACGPGIYTIPAAKMVGSDGFVYCADINPEAEKYIKNKIQKNGLLNVKIQITDWKLSILDEEIDIVLLFDAIHVLKNREKVLREIHRVLKPRGILAVEIHHISLDEGIIKVKSVKDNEKNKNLFKVHKCNLSNDPALPRLVLFSKELTKLSQN
ncbi:MAG: class I SAM-dependent methyltransferase [Candidatus Lokiarchaeota archaeon]|nr:class I SAM-dependent methyltransferase [Candidatus Harpocratesius repetitus]